MYYLGFLSFIFFLMMDLDVLFMYLMIWNVIIMLNLSKGWGNFFDVIDIKVLDDIEWICYYCNMISYEYFVEMMIEDFNILVLDFIMVLMLYLNIILWVDENEKLRLIFKMFKIL